MKGIALDEINTRANFDEVAYLAANADVADAVRSGQFQSGLQHFLTFGEREGRKLRCAPGECVPVQFPRTDKTTVTLESMSPAAALAAAKAAKLARIDRILRDDMPCDRREGHPNFLSADLRKQFRIVATDAVSSNNYDGHVMALLERHADGLVLDCGAGRRSVYFDNVVNFEIAPYDTTDVQGVGEELPFRDESFDAVISIAVLEHVKDPFRCAREIVRVLKPGGELICAVPFLQPYHGYPHHYYNMTHQGLTNLFDGMLSVGRVEVYDSVLPIWSLVWILESWAAGLSGSARAEFLDMRVRDLLQPPQTFLRRKFVTGLAREKNLELASACVLFGRK